MVFAYIREEMRIPMDTSHRLPENKTYYWPFVRGIATGHRWILLTKGQWHRMIITQHSQRLLFNFIFASTSNVAVSRLWVSWVPSSYLRQGYAGSETGPACHPWAGYAGPRSSLSGVHRRIVMAWSWRGPRLAAADDLATSPCLQSNPRGAVRGWGLVAGLWRPGTGQPRASRPSCH